jgi:hypothetical protein
MTMSGKVLPSRKVSSPAGRDLGSFPQRTPPNPSQTNGNSPPTVPSVQRALGPVMPVDYSRNGR